MLLIGSIEIIICGNYQYIMVYHFNFLWRMKYVVVNNLPKWNEQMQGAAPNIYWMQYRQASLLPQSKLGLMIENAITHTYSYKHTQTPEGYSPSFADSSFDWLIASTLFALSSWSLRRLFLPWSSDIFCRDVLYSKSKLLFQVFDSVLLLFW